MEKEMFQLKMEQENRLLIILLLHLLIVRSRLIEILTQIIVAPINNATLLLPLLLLQLLILIPIMQVLILI